MCVATFLLVAHVRIGGTLPSHLPLDMDTETALVMATSIGGLSWLLNLAGEARSRQISRGTPRHHGLYDSQQRLQQQVDALSPEDRRLLDQVKFQREDNLTPRERRKFANCMKIRVRFQAPLPIIAFRTPNPTPAPLAASLLTVS